MQDEESKPIEENLELVNYIMLHRIYDILLLIANKIAGSEETEKMSKYHEQGFLLSSPPAYNSENNE